jgi:outer membrane lipoprotein-sorting protein
VIFLEDKLKDLDEKMNSSILKDLEFSEKRKQEVLRNIKNMKKERIVRRGFFKPVLSTVVIGVLCLGIGFFTLEQVRAPSKKQEAHMEQKEKETENSPAAKDEYYKDMTKQEILTKMLNTIDHFESAKGSFEEFTHNTKRRVEYELDMGKVKGGWGKSTSTYQKEVNSKMNYYDQDNVWVIDEKTQSLREAGYSHPSTCCTLTLKEAFTKDSAGIDMTMTRDRPPIGLAQNSLFPYEIASNYTRNLDKWEIEEQNEELIGHNTLVLSGELDSYASIKTQSNTFRFWVDKDTGILVKYETYNSTGDVVHYLHPKQLLVNQKVDTEKHKPDLSKYKRR